MVRGAALHSIFAFIHNRHYMPLILLLIAGASGEATLIWDRIFGSYFNPDRAPPRNVGLGSAVRVSSRFFESLLQPFTPKGHRASDAHMIRQLPAGDAGVVRGDTGHALASTSHA